MTDTLRIVIPGPPQTKQRPRVGRGGHFYSPTSRDEKVVGMLAFAEANRQRWIKATGPVCVNFVFYGARKNADLDNMEKFYSDAMNTVIYEDDRQIVEKHTIRQDGDPRTEITVIKMGDE